jgi:hypothetical protein
MEGYVINILHSDLALEAVPLGRWTSTLAAPGIMKGEHDSMGIGGVKEKTVLSRAVLDIDIEFAKDRAGKEPVVVIIAIKLVTGVFPNGDGLPDVFLSDSAIVEKLLYVLNVYDYYFGQFHAKTLYLLTEAQIQHR